MLGSEAVAVVAAPDSRSRTTHAKSEIVAGAAGTRVLVQKRPIYFWLHQSAREIEETDMKQKSHDSLFGKFTLGSTE